MTAGDYPITVGAGGVVNTGVAGTTVNGGNTTAFDFTAFGGGPGAPATGYGATIGNIGASGGGGATDGAPKEGEGRGLIHGGTAKASAENFNLGNAGADAYTNGTAGPKYNGGGGGGAGAAASGVAGGDGYACDITGTTAYYGGGGKASWGGGGSGQYGNSNAADGFNTTPQPGGRGIVILRYKKPELAFILVVR